jgi:hypothetical protein
MVDDLRLPIGPGYLLREHMHVKLETDTPIGTLAGIKAHSKHLGIVERWPRAKRDSRAAEFKTSPAANHALP